MQSTGWSSRVPFTPFVSGIKGHVLGAALFVFVLLVLCLDRADHGHEHCLGPKDGPKYEFDGCATSITPLPGSQAVASDMALWEGAPGPQQPASSPSSG